MAKAGPPNQSPGYMNLNVEAFLDALAARTPTPGGGAAAALTGALGCAAARMVMAYSVGGKTPPEEAAVLSASGEQLRRCDQMLRLLVAEDAAAYEELAARRRSSDKRPSSPFAAAVETAVAVPMNAAAVCATALRVMDEYKGRASRFLLSDLGVAARLAEAGAAAARHCVRVNLADVADAAKRREHDGRIDEIVAHCTATRESIEQYLTRAM